MIVILEQVALLMLFVLVGFYLAKSKKADSSHSKLLSVLAVNVFLPATCFNTFAKNFTPTYLRENYMLLLVSAASVVIAGVAAFFVAKMLTKEDYQRKIFQYSLTTPNYGYMGYALAGGVFGDQVLLSVMMFALPVSVYTYTLGYCMLTKSKLTVKKLLNPVTMSMLLGAVVGLSGIQLPNFATSFLSKAAACMGPAGMLLTGMVISQYQLKTLVSNKSVYIVAFIRLIVIPFVLALALKALSLQALVVPALMVMAMPCGLNTIVFPKLVGEECETGASLAFVTSILCCATIPLCLAIFAGGVM